MSTSLWALFDDIFISSAINFKEGGLAAEEKTMEVMMDPWICITNDIKYKASKI